MLTISRNLTRGALTATLLLCACELVQATNQRALLQAGDWREYRRRQSPVGHPQGSGDGVGGVVEPLQATVEELRQDNREHRVVAPSVQSER